ncbi:GDP-Man:Man(3)GlcNAc(2)-PP-Dol alpha-1,2-mannosyltransferase [Daphnia magna]|uniref:GDP-Man:Man(3)GlcNAc(2)-PP-Dol alpha-1,2-mannosyltransferase n=1 Tax=Daphnia magna TaxID=35525 RepID=A0A0P6H904_9CRUS|nr:GDP-Man:Man(3)GlcNAc(2)-PP-Dol alpha-1,2-mannosyltransferase [Daphnia magna]KZS15184.1 Asparagine-linked glycosylation protein 11 protein [Daphnia magna]
MTFILVLLIVPLAFLLFLFFLKKIILRNKTLLKNRLNGKTVVGIFHPYCNAGGGGERVLWCAIRAIQSQYPDIHVVVYTGDSVPAEDLLQNAFHKFNIRIQNNNIEFVKLYKRSWVEAQRYPYFTLLGQSLGSLVLGTEALLKLVPDVFIDTMGYSFTFPLFHLLGGCTVACYVHYPTISTDMLGQVANRTAAFNNNTFISRNPILSQAKIIYYKLFAYMYGISGRYAQTIMVNSSWTEDHINQIWNVPLRTHKVYPPCDVKEFLEIPVDCDPQYLRIIAVAQFRPEKDHPLMIRSFYKLMDILTDEEKSRVKLVLVGSCRNEEDQRRVDDYKRLSKHFNIENHTEFYVNVEFNELKHLMEESTIGLHTMWNEHFGISIVECMASGLIMVAHKSGGPMMDIIIHSQGSQPIGFLGSDEMEYADIMRQIIRMKPKQRELIREAARESVARFSDESFEKEFLRVFIPLIR